MQVQSLAISWQIYDMERTPLALGLVGLCQFVPIFLLSLPAGEIADRFDQRRVLAIAQLVQALCAGLFVACSVYTPHQALPFYAILVLFGAARGFSEPCSQSLLAFLVPPDRLARSIALSSSVLTMTVIAGPALGGFLFSAGPVTTYSICLASFVMAAGLTLTCGGRRLDHTVIADGSRWARVVEGIRFVRHRPIVLGAISLDLFAVLLGGAVALLPIFARDILHTGPMGLGILRSAPAVGAALVAFWLARRPIERHTGSRMFWAVAIFWFSLAVLVVLGAADMISVFIRSSLISTATPDRMRGRVSAVNMLFVGASNELGGFESGVTAAWFGAIPAVVWGGIGTLVVVGLWMRFFPPLRHVDRLSDVAPGA